MVGVDEPTVAGFFVEDLVSNCDAYQVTVKPPWLYRFSPLSGYVKALPFACDRILRMAETAERSWNV